MESTYKPYPGLPISIVIKFKSIFEDWSHEDLLRECLHYLTQNQNESFNALIRERLPKSRYVPFTSFQFGVHDPVANFNISRKARVLFIQNLGMTPGNETLTGCKTLNQHHLSATSYNNLDSIKRRRKIRRVKAKGHVDVFRQRDMIWKNRAKVMKQMHFEHCN